MTLTAEQERYLNQLAHYAIGRREWRHFGPRIDAARDGKLTQNELSELFDALKDVRRRYRVRRPSRKRHAPEHVAAPPSREGTPAAQDPE